MVERRVSPRMLRRDAAGLGPRDAWGRRPRRLPRAVRFVTEGVAPDHVRSALLLLAFGYLATVVRLFRDQRPRDPARGAARAPVDAPGVSVLVGAHVTRWRRRSATAQIAELVRRGSLRLVPGRPTRATVASVADLDPVEHAFLAALVGGEPVVGAPARLHPLDPGTAHAVRRVQARVNELVVEQGLRVALRPRRGRVLLRVLAVALAVAAVRLAVQDPRTWFVPISLAVCALVDPRRHTVRPLSAEGAAVRDQLQGIADTLRWGGPASLAQVDLPALHPWAVLFGQLDAWRARGGVEDPTLHALLVELGGDRPEAGSDDEQPGDAWSAEATGGSHAEHDGAYVSHEE